MSIGVLGTPHGTNSTGNSTTARTGTYAAPAGSRRLGFICVSRGYCNGATSVFPSTMTWGGQSISMLTTEVEAFGPSNCGSALYMATESQIAAMSGGAYTITYDTSIPGTAQVTVQIVVLGDCDQTLADTDQVAGSYSSMSVALTTTSGDLCLGFFAERGDQGDLTLGSGMTSVLTTNASSSNNEYSSQRTDSITASGASTTVQCSGDAGGLTTMHAVAITEDTGGGGGGSGNLPLLQAIGEAA